MKNRMETEKEKGKEKQRLVGQVEVKYNHLAKSFNS